MKKFALPLIILFAVSLVAIAAQKKEGPIRAAKAKGCKFVISTDAHHPKHLANMSYGVSNARRGWLEPGDILNTRSADEFAKVIR